ncbi:JAB-like toxin 1 domain-containing protein [Bacteroides faecalis]|uniref:Type IV secretion protein Rhs n=1 Tax=Bacteroides faecalis TaxID=2447885 RepID=A0A401LZT9_9BACE|nr:JAB-like toxin 1 domain-containing protein [Bacteroides faecalis]GCB37051.1 hypothetical protein KGMB02408_39960 [Bacteroides faecalis]
MEGGTETTDRGYRFTYDGLSRLKNASYGEGATFATNQNRFNEQITGYDKMGNILGLQRYGQISATAYGLIDNLTLTYNGNQLQAVKDAATSAVFGNGLEFKDGANQTVEYTYDKNGNLIKDLNKNISSIGYNCLNLPNQVIFTGGNSVEYEYGADGTKLRTLHKTGSTTLTTDYCGNAVYENGVLKMLLNEAGYVSFPDKKYHFYLKDHQGNTRVVADKDGNVEETNSYYPFGGTFTSTASVQPYKYNGKELDQKNGLNWYDYGARHYDATLARWHVADPSAEKYYNWSPYTYCKTSPVLRIDVDGKDDYVINKAGMLFNQTPDSQKGLSSTDNLSFSADPSKSITVDKGLLEQIYEVQKSTLGQRPSYGSTQNLETAASVFKFAADNTSVEWKLDVYDDNGTRAAVVSTSRDPQAVQCGTVAQEKLSVKGKKIIDIHSHLPGGTKGGAGNDFNLADPKRKNAVYLKDYGKEGMLYEYNKKRSQTNSIPISDDKDLLEYIKH